MSTHRLSVSGQRSQTLVDGAGFRAAQYDSKAGDGVTTMLGNLHELSAVLPQGGTDENGRRYGAWITHIKAPRSDTVYAVLRIYGRVHEVGDKEGSLVKQSMASVTFHGVPTDGGHPITNVDVRKHDPEVDPYLAAYGLYDEVEALPLVSPPTPAPEPDPRLAGVKGDDVA